MPVKQFLTQNYQFVIAGILVPVVVVIISFLLQKGKGSVKKTTQKDKPIIKGDNNTQENIQVQGSGNVIAKKYIKLSAPQVGIKTKDEIETALVSCKIASILPNTIAFNFLEDWKVWFLIENRERKKYKAYIKIKFISGNYEKEVRGSYYGGTKAWNLNALSAIVADGLGIPEEIKERAKRGEKIEIRIFCEVKDENDELIEVKLPVGYVYDYKNNNWYYEP